MREELGVEGDRREGRSDASLDLLHRQVLECRRARDGLVTVSSRWCRARWHPLSLARRRRDGVRITSLSSTRAHTALQSMSVPTLQDITHLTSRVHELERRLEVEATLLAEEKERVNTLQQDNDSFRVFGGVLLVTQLALLLVVGYCINA